MVDGRVRVEFDFVPNPSQMECFMSPAKFILANGGVGSGKSTLIAMKGIGWSYTHQGTVGLIGRKTYPELRDTTRKTFFQRLPPVLVDKWNSTFNELRLKGGSVILFRALDDIFKLGSLELGWFAIDELAEFEDDEVFHFLRHRLRHPKGPLKGFGATNPATKEHWLHKLFVESQDPDFTFFQVPTYANRENLPEAYLRDLEKMPVEWQNRYLQGEWGIIPKGTRVISKFRPSVHLGSFTYNPYRPLWRGWDFGFRHPACIFMQETEWGRVLFLREILGTEIQIDDFADMVIRKTNEWFPKIERIEDFCDIAGTQRSDKSKITSVQMLQKKGIDPRYKKTVDLEKELMNFNNMFETMRGDLPMIGVDRAGCPIFSDGLAGGYYRNEKGEVTGDDFYDHLIDAARYVLSNILGNQFRRMPLPKITSYYPTLSDRAR